jgi:hypothetical protein
MENPTFAYDPYEFSPYPERALYPDTQQMAQYMRRLRLVEAPAEIREPVIDPSMLVHLGGTAVEGLERGMRGISEETNDIAFRLLHDGAAPEAPVIPLREGVTPVETDEATDTVVVPFARWQALRELSQVPGQEAYRDARALKLSEAALRQAA